MLLVPGAVVPCLAHSGFNPLPPSISPDYPSSEGAVPRCSCLCSVGQGLSWPASLMAKIKISLAALPKTFDCTMLCAAYCTGFFVFLHCVEFLLPDDVPFEPSLHLCLADLHLVRSPHQWRFYVCIKVSKTDQICVGSVVALGATGITLCAIASLLDYRSTACITSLSQWCGT